MRRSTAFVCLVFIVIALVTLTETNGYAEPVIFIIGIIFYAHYHFVGGSYITFRRRKHQRAAKDLAGQLISTSISSTDIDHEHKLRLYREVIVKGLNNWLIERKLIHSFRLSLMKEIERQKKLVSIPLSLTTDVDDAIDHIVLCFDNERAWK